MFSKDEYDLGKTHLVEHDIETGDAPPVKLPPRRFPLAFADWECKCYFFETQVTFLGHVLTPEGVLPDL